MAQNRQPVGYTCPDIDGYIKNIKQVIYSDKYLESLSEDDLLQCAKNINYELENCIDYLEDLRSSNDKLRRWGQEEADRVDELENQLCDAESEIEDLKSQLSE